MATITKKITIQPGEPFIIPPNVDILYVSDSNSLQTDCIEIPATGPLICYTFSWSIELDRAGGSGPWNYDTTVLSKFVIPGVLEYTFNDRVTGGTYGLYPTGSGSNQSWNPGVNNINYTLYQTINNDPEFPGQIVSLKRGDNVFGETYYSQLIIKMPEVIGANAYLTFDGPGFNAQLTTDEGSARIYAHRCDECCETGGGSLPEA